MTAHCYHKANDSCEWKRSQANLCLAIWFCAQCFTRFHQGLSISLLELNTFGHAICTLFTYVLWWHKPLDIEEPERVTFDPDADAENSRRSSQILAAMCCKSKLEGGSAEIGSFYPQDKSFYFRHPKNRYDIWPQQEHDPGTGNRTVDLEVKPEGDDLALEFR